MYKCKEVFEEIRDLYISEQITASGALRVLSIFFDLDKPWPETKLEERVFRWAECIN